MVNGVARDIIDPEKNISLSDRLKAKLLTSDFQSLKMSRRAPGPPHWHGFNGDYTAFIDHLGVASLNIDFKDEDRGGIYHSVYDDFYWYTHFSDTDFVYGRAFRRRGGGDRGPAHVLPYDFVDFAETMRRRRRGQ